MSNITRKLASIRVIDDVEPIDGADAIEVVTLGGWKVVTKKSEFAKGDLCVYFEIDSFLPAGVPAWQFLVDKSSREFEGVVGHRLRTIKLRGQVSQGLVLPVSALGGFTVSDEFGDLDFTRVEWQAGEDVTELLGIKKWEQPLPAELSGQAEGMFPSFIPRTDQERCQNIVSDIFGYEDTRVLIEGLNPEQADQAAILGGKLLIEDGKVYSVREAKADRNAQYEVSMKLDGSSITVFARQVTDIDGVVHVESGVCSRNLQLKVNAENASNTFIATAVNSGLLAALQQLAAEGRHYAVQGELMGPSIQGNRENLKTFKFFMFDVFDISAQRKLTPAERVKVLFSLYDLGVNAEMVDHVPVLGFTGFDKPLRGITISHTLDGLDITNVKELLIFAEGPSLVHPVREGLVFKRIDGEFSFKAISNIFLAKEKD